ncbi:hypothetical protein LWI29_012392 [Acer saccharum]|uniref:Uncharacterized protein n=1 Tax=Acer saccharum TaxID=4024 RepID=A0AA39VC32_ACESA|nr:hypothetical protein LWI29_012392 [Acer saccharum]
MSKAGLEPPTAIPLDRPVTDKSLEPVISLDPEDTEGGGPPTYYVNRQALGSLLDTKKKYARVKDLNSKLYDKIKRDRGLVESLRDKLEGASTFYRKSKAECRKKHEKLIEYRYCLRSANETIESMKRDLGENAVDRYVISDEGYKRDKDIFDRAVEDLKVMLGNKYPDFDFSEFHKEVAAA